MNHYYSTVSLGIWTILVSSFFFVALESSFGRRDEMCGQLRGEIVSVQFDVHEVHGEGELVGVQHPVLIHVGELPNLAQDVVGELRLDHLFLGI